MQSISAADHAPWYSTLTRAQWKTLAAANLGWMFDGYETFALILTVGVALRQLLDPSLFPQIPAYAGTVIAVTLLGWGVGGIIGGILADYIGRRRTMIFRDPGLFAHDRSERVRLGLDVLRGLAVPCRRCHRLGVGNRRLDHRRGVAGPRPRQRARVLCNAGSASGFSWHRWSGSSSAISGLVRGAICI